jgi:hypothetical protein
MTTQNDNTLTAHADAAVLMLAAADDREAFNAMLLQLSFGEARDLLLAMAEVGGTLVTLGDAYPVHTSRHILRSMLAACRNDDLG